MSALLLILSCKTNLKEQITEFQNFPTSADPIIIGEKLSERFLSRPHSNTGSWYTEEQKRIPDIFNHPVGYVVYPDVCAWYGALGYAKLAQNKKLFERLTSRTAKVVYGDEQNLIPKPNHVDNNIFGIIPLKIYPTNKDKRFLNLGLFMADEQFRELSPEEYNKLSSNEQKWYDMGLSWNTRMWIDDMYMITILQAQAFKITRDKKYINRAANEMTVYLKELQKENGLFYHADNVPIFWGRGNGWVAAGMAELLCHLPEDNEYYPFIQKRFQKMMSTLLVHQNEKGLWNQIVNDPHAWTETSGSGMFTFAFITGVKNGWLDKSIYAPAARKAWIALCSYINPEGDVTDICIGTNKKNDYQYYLDRDRMIGDLHGQAPVLWCAAALLK